MGENKLKHLEFIQNVINRMAGNSFLIKSWAITLIAALFALSSKDSNHNYIIISFFPVIIFWVLNGYFLSQERLFRALYNHVRQKDDANIDFSMGIDVFRDEKNNWFCSIFSSTLLLFYLTLIIVMSIFIFLIN